MEMTPCPHCGKMFKLLKAHITKTHETMRVEVRKDADGDYLARLLRNGEIVEDWDCLHSSGESYSGKADEYAEWCWIEDGHQYVVQVDMMDYAVGTECSGRMLHYLSDNWKGAPKKFGVSIVFVE
jgi:uncharacterized protein YegP (UPF0339 family)